MSKSIRITCLALLSLLWLDSVFAQSFDTSKLQGLGDTRYHQLNSETLGHALHLYVRVPASAAENPGRRYPTIYLLDGGTSYPLLSAYYHYLRFTEEIPEMVVVGLSYGSDTFEGGNFRSSDYTAPSAEREWWGGASVFQGVLEHEVIPLVEQNYPSDPARRIILGQSLAGQFVLYSSLTRPELFWGHIASNPALHRNLDFFLSWHGSKPMPLDATRLFIAEGEFDDDQFKQPATQWVEFWSAPGVAKPFILEARILAGQTHVSNITEAFRQGVLWLMSERK